MCNLCPLRIAAGYGARCCSRAADLVQRNGRALGWPCLLHNQILRKGRVASVVVVCASLGRLIPNMRPHKIKAGEHATFREQLLARMRRPTLHVGGPRCCQGGRRYRSWAPQRWASSASVRVLGMSIHASPSSLPGTPCNNCCTPQPVRPVAVSEAAPKL